MSSDTASPTVSIVRATSADVPAITLVAAGWRPGDRDAGDLAEHGFLVSDFTADEYHHLIQRSDHAYIARHAGRVVGFLIAYSESRLREIDDPTARWLTTRLDSFIMIKQVAVERDATGLGIGRALYLHLIRQLHGEKLVAAVVDEPVNVRSQVFHRSLGFSPAYSVRHPDGKMRTVWRYDDFNTATEVLAAQYQAAISLYAHEDGLNWEKLRNYLYITVAAAAAFGFILNPADQGRDRAGLGVNWLAFGLCLLGLVTSIGFVVALFSGVAYLAMRKEAVTELEDIYVRKNGVRVVSRLLAVHPWLKRSPTTWVLRLIPAMGALVWVAATCYLFLVL